MVATFPGDNLLIGRRPVRNWTRPYDIKLVLCRKSHSFLGKWTETTASRAALFDCNMHQTVCRLGLCPRPHWGSLQIPELYLGGLLLKGGGREGGDEGRQERKGMVGAGREGGGSSSIAIGRKKKSRCLCLFVWHFLYLDISKLIRSSLHVPTVQLFVFCEHEMRCWHCLSVCLYHSVIS